MGREAVSKSLPQFLLLVLISLLLIFFENLGFLKPAHVLAEKSTKPVKLTLFRSWQKTQSAFSFLTFWRSGSQKIQNLEERNRELLVEAQKAKVLEEENRTLRAQLKISLPSDWHFQEAQTLGKSRYLTLDKGEKDGVKVGQVAILKNFLVGKVIKVSPYESQVELPTDPEGKIPVRTASTGARGILSGQFGKGMVLEKVTQGEILEMGDLVETTGEGGYPKGLMVGKIAWVERKENEVFQKAGLEPMLNYDSLEWVFLIK